MFDEEGHGVVELLQVVLQVGSRHLDQRSGRKEKQLSERTQSQGQVCSPKVAAGPYVSGPEDVRGEHEGQVEGRHLVALLLPGRVVQQVQQQLEQRAVGRRQQQQQELQRLHLALLVGHSRLVAVLVQQGQICSRRKREGQKDKKKETIFFFPNHFLGVGGDPLTPHTRSQKIIVVLISK